MNQWAFVIGAYAAVLLPTTILLIASAMAMRRAEADADAMKSRP